MADTIFQKYFGRKTTKERSPDASIVKKQDISEEITGNFQKLISQRIDRV